ncbi:MAG: autotransporter outer membrane beta-barrel domain-containing protein [Alphaproteobacteria bacterium]|nr:MAG: autotransporter outer membrane beta-barrel domain-containing protein [Alphaproteobacteria bacterium]
MPAKFKSRLLLGACSLAYLSSPAFADVTISDEQAGPLATSTINAGAADNIILESTGIISAAGGVALTIDSGNTVTNGGQITVDDVDNSTVVLILGGLTGELDNNYLITTPADNVKNLATGKYGVRLMGPGDFTGDITNELGGTIRVGGANSYAVALETGLIGNFTNLGTIAANGDNNTAVWVGADITGDFRNRGNISAQTLVYEDETDPDNILYFVTDTAVGIGASISGGFLNDGLTYQEAIDDIEDPDRSFGTITSSGAVATVWISPELNAAAPADITLGPVTSKGDGQGFLNLGVISAAGQATQDATAVWIEGYFDGFTTYTVDLSGGLRSDNTIKANASDADATALYIGANVIVPEIVNYGAITAAADGTEEIYSVTALKVATTPDSVDIVNYGAIAAQAYVESQSILAIQDVTGAISSITNTGTISAWELTPNAQQSRSQIAGTAIDLTANTTGTLIVNEKRWLTEGADPDDPDDDVYSNARINGDILMGSGDDTFMFNSGRIDGDVSLGMGLDYFFLGAESIFNGFLISEYGTASADIEGNLALNSAATVDLDTLTIADTSTITLNINPDALNAGFMVGNLATLDPGVTFATNFESIITANTTYTIIGGAGAIDLLGGLGSLVLEETPYAYNIALVLNDDLVLQIAPKTAEELGLNESLTTFYDPLREAMNINTNLTTSFHSIVEQREFERVLNGALPDDTNASFELGQLAFRNIAQSATDRPLLSAQRYRTGQFWATENGFTRTQDPSDTARGYSASGFQMAGGYEVTNGLFDQLGVGLALSSISSEPDGSESKPYKSWTTWLLGYGVTSFDRLTLTGLYGYGMSENRSNRILTVQGTRYKAEADWTGTMHGGYFEAKYRLGADDLYMDPYASITYLSLDEDAYQEKGDVGFILRGGEFSQTGTIGEIGTVFGMETQGKRMFYTTEFKIGYRDSSVDEPYNREYQFYKESIPDVDPGYDGTPFMLYGPEMDGGAAVIGFSIFGESDLTRIGFAYEGTFGDGGTDHRLQLVLKWRF